MLVCTLVASLIIGLLPISGQAAAPAQLKSLKSSLHELDPANGNISSTLTLTTKNISDGETINWTVSGADSELVSLASNSTLTENNNSKNNLILIGSARKKSTIKVIASYGNKKKTIGIKLCKCPDITIKVPEELQLDIGSNSQISAIYYPTDASVSYSSDNTNIATVSESGQVTAVSPGTAIITAIASKSESTATDNIQVTVKNTGLTIASVESCADITTTIGTQPHLPATATITLSDGSKLSTGVSWETPDVSAAGSKTLSGTLINPAGVTNPLNIRASVRIIVNTAANPTADITLTLVTPAGEGNSISVGGPVKQGNVEVVNNTSSVVLGCTKSSAQTITVTGADAKYVTTTGSSTSSIYTINTSAIAKTGGSYYFVLTASQTGKDSISYAVTVKVAAPPDPTADISLTLGTPMGSGNVLTVGADRSGSINVQNGTSQIILNGKKSAKQTITLGGTGAKSITVGGTSTNPVFTIDTSDIATAGGDKFFVMTVSETEKSSIMYVFLAVVATPTPETSSMALALTSPLPGAGNSITGGGDNRTAIINAGNGTTSVILTGSKKTSQAVSIGGMHSSLVTQTAGTTAAPVFTVNTSSIAASGGSKNFTLTVNETGKQSIVYTITVTIAPAVTNYMTLALTSPVAGADNTINVGDTVMTGTVNVSAGTSSVILTGGKSASQTVSIGGINASSVTAGGTDTIPVYTIDTADISTGGNKSFTLTVQETGKTNLVYSITLTVAAMACTSEISLNMSNPSGGINTFALDTAAHTGTATVANSTASIEFTGGKTAAQTVTVGGINATDITTGGTDTVPVYTLDTTNISASGGIKNFILNVSETNKLAIAYSINAIVLAPPTSDMPLTLTTPTTGAITGGGILRNVSVNVPNGTTSVRLTGTKTAAQAVETGGANAADVSIGGTATAVTYTISTATIAAAGGDKSFTITVNETGKSSITYNISLHVNNPNPATSDITMVLAAPAPSALNTYNISSSGTFTRTVTVNVVNTTASVVLNGSKLTDQTVVIGGSSAAYVTAGGTATAPVYTVNTSTIAAAGGSRVFTMAVSETGKSTVVYTVTVQVAAPLYTSNMNLALTSPAPENGNSIDVGGAVRTGTINVVNGTGSVLITGSKLSTQSVVISGTSAGYVTMGGIGTAPLFAVNTSSIAAAGGTRSFALTVSEAGKASIAYTITLRVAAPGTVTSNISLDLTLPAVSPGNSIAVGGVTKSGIVTVVNGTSIVKLTGGKTNTQSIAIGGANASDVTLSGTATAPVFTINTGGIAAAGGTRIFTIVVTETGKTAITYTVTVRVTAPLTPTANVALALTSPVPGVGNTINVGGSVRTGTVNVINGTTSIVLTGTKTASQTVTVMGTDAASVTPGGTATVPTYTINVSSIATGGSKNFTLIVSEASRSNITYDVTVNVANLVPTADIAIALSSPAAGGGNSISVGGISKTGSVNVVNGTATVLLAVTKTANQAISVDGADAGCVSWTGSATDPVYTIDTVSIVTGGSLTFNMTVSEASKQDIVYNVTIAVAT